MKSIFGLEQQYTYVKGRRKTIERSLFMLCKRRLGLKENCLVNKNITPSLFEDKGM